MWSVGMCKGPQVSHDLPDCVAGKMGLERRTSAGNSSRLMRMPSLGQVFNISSIRRKRVADLVRFLPGM